MSEHAFTVAEQAMQSRSRKRGLVWAIMPVTFLVLIDLGLSALAFMISYKLHNDTPVFEWRRKFSLPTGIWDAFEPYFSIMLFVPFVKIYALRRYGLYRLRGEFSFSNDFIKVFNASTLAFLILVLIAFLFRQGFAFRDGRLILLDFTYSRLVFVYDWLISMGMFWVTRMVVRVIQILYRSSEGNLIPTIVVGCGEMAQVCISEISEKPRLGYK
ncbi:MAG TPA: hypothetical protein VNI02_18395, partial [Blastocatellia bacterium]|nr:hypothetical protein [Blastocatellia bacterium]